MVEDAIRVHVIERWSKYRAQQFFEAFCQSLLDAGISDEEIGKTLDELLADETKSEVVFEAYRAVCLTKSQVLGPRIIALLTAEIVIAASKADSSDQLIFSAAEELSDSEFEEFSEFAISQIAQSQKDEHKDIEVLSDGSLSIQIADETLDSNWLREESISVGPLDLASDIGAWAPKLKRLGLVSDEVRERQWRYEENGERHIDQPGTAREITWWLSLTKQSLVLATLVRRARGGG